MAILDAVVILRIFGLDTSAIFALVRVAVTLVIIALTIRIPFKRNYHWMFLAVEVAMLVASAGQALADNASTAAIGLSISQAWYTSGLWGNSEVQVLLIYQFVLYFVSRKPSIWERLVLLAAYVYVITLVWIPLPLDPALLNGSAHASIFGISIGNGGLDVYKKPDGLDIFTTVLAIPIFVLLVRYYRSEKSPLVRGQTKYLIVGLVVIFIGFYTLYVERYFGGPNFTNLISSPGDFVLLLGLRKKGFYSVTPVAEMAAATALIRHPLQEGRSYLGHDPKVAFEDFAGLVKSGYEGLLITRTYPEDVRKDYGLQTTPIRWLADRNTQDAIPPEDLLGISLTVKDFLEKATRPVVMLHGLEFLTTSNGFTPVLKLVHGLTDSNAAKRGILILPIVPDSLKKQDEALLVAETTPMPA